VTGSRGGFQAEPQSGQEEHDARTQRRQENSQNTVVIGGRGHDPAVSMTIPRELIASLHDWGVTLHAKPWTNRNGERFPKHAFTIRLADQRVEYPPTRPRPSWPAA
jgi:hypothetical protein